MRISEIMSNENVNFSGINSSYFLIGLISAFENRFQAMADKAMEEISWKQFFAVICVNLCRESPTINELSEIMGSSHQNVKQILLKLEKKGFISFVPDAKDKRKQLIVLTDYCREFCSMNDERSAMIMENMFRGISEEQLQITIKTLIDIENNIKALDNGGN